MLSYTTRNCSLQWHVYSVSYIQLLEAIFMKCPKYVHSTVINAMCSCHVKGLLQNHSLRSLFFERFLCKVLLTSFGKLKCACMFKNNLRQANLYDSTCTAVSAWAAFCSKRQLKSQVQTHKIYIFISYA